MKNLLVFISPDKKFNKECELLSRIQIDNAISLGLKDDLLLVTNFDYEYNGIKSIIVGDENFCAVRPRSLKTSIVPYLVDLGLFNGDICWNHDFDAYQLEVITNEELGLEGLDAGFTDYGWKSRWCLGSDFFKESAKDIFQSMKEIIFTNVEDEDALAKVLEDEKIALRIKKMNITYQIGMRNVSYNCKKATKPFKVFHFHPSKPGLMEIFTPLMPKRLLEVFNYHGIH
jgi:hypothetical protein